MGATGDSTKARAGRVERWGGNFVGDGTEVFGSLVCSAAWRFNDGFFASVPHSQTGMATGRRRRAGSGGYTGS